MKAAKKHLDLAIYELKDKLQARQLPDKVAEFIADSIKETLSEKQIKQIIIQLLQ